MTIPERENKIKGAPATYQMNDAPPIKKKGTCIIQQAKGKIKMKRTGSMNYKETEESRELFLYVTNSGELYRRMITGTIESLQKKAKKGIYSTEKAVDAFYHVATAASDLYNKEFGYKFSVQDRFTAATDMEAYYREDEIFYGLN